MKRALSTLLVCALLLGMILTLVSCGNMLFGTYELGNVTYEFKGNKVTKTTVELITGKNIVETGTYKITGDEGERKITFTYEDEEPETYEFSSGENEGKEYIRIGLFTYTKAD